MAAYLSQRLGWISSDDYQRVVRIMKMANLPVEAPQDMTPEDFMTLMAVDKKVIDGQLRLILLKALGKAVVTDQFDPVLLQQTLVRFAA